MLLHSHIVFLIWKTELYHSRSKTNILILDLWVGEKLDPGGKVKKALKPNIDAVWKVSSKEILIHFIPNMTLITVLILILKRK